MSVSRATFTTVGILSLGIALVLVLLGCAPALAAPEDAVKAQKPCQTYIPEDPASRFPGVTICAWGIEDLREFEILYHPRRALPGRST